jgi:hypothetical protein
MQTCCVENETPNEYQRIAEHARTLLVERFALYDAIEQALIAAFDEDWVESKHVVAVLEKLASS